MKLLVTGSRGLLGSAIRHSVAKLDEQSQFHFVSREDADLLSKKDTFDLFDEVKPDVIIHTAALVGGLGGNMSRPYEYFARNLILNQNVIDASLNSGVQRFIGFLSTCIFPSHANYPLSSGDLHNGPPDDSNFGYAHAKRALDVGLRAAHSQLGLNFDLVTLSNLYGPNDNFDVSNGHVIPSLIHKFYNAITQGGVPEVWGDGSPLREFTFAEDVAKAILAMLSIAPRNESFILSNPQEVTIRDLAFTLDKLLGGKGEIRFLEDRPNGQLRKPSSSEELGELESKIAFTSIQDGLTETVGWFLQNYPHVRGAMNHAQ